MSDSLTERDRKRLTICEKTVREGLQTCFDTGAALLEIKTNRLYRETSDTFERYCQETFQIGRSHAYRLIESAQVKDSVADSKIGKEIINESQARALSEVPEKNRVKVLKVAQNSEEGVTASGIRGAAEKLNLSPIGDIDQPIKSGISLKTAPQKPTPVVEVDQKDYRIPEPALEFWNRRQEVQDMLTAISRIKGIIEKAQESGDEMFREVMYSGLISDLKNVYSGIQVALPYAVCTTCQGQVPKRCTFCRGRGLISKFRWDTSVPKEIKEMRRKATEAQK